MNWIVSRPDRQGDKPLIIHRDTPRKALLAYLDTHGIAFRAAEGIACVVSNGYRNEYTIGSDRFVVKAQE